jgi:hypothetical protein
MTNTFLFEFSCYNVWDCVLFARHPSARGIKGENDVGIWTVHNKEPHHLCTSPNFPFLDEVKKNQNGGVSGKLEERVGSVKFGREN